MCYVLVSRSRKVESELVDASLNEKKRQADQAGSGGWLNVAHRGAVTGVVTESTGSQQLLVSAGVDRTVKVWSLLNNQLLCVLTGHSHSVCLCLCVCLSVWFAICVCVSVSLLVFQGENCRGNWGVVPSQFLSRPF